MSKALYESINPRQLSPEQRQLAASARTREAERLEGLIPKPPMDEDLRRLLLSVINVMKRKYPTDYRRMLAEFVA